MKLFRVFFRTLLCSVLPFCLLCGSVTVSAYSGNYPQQKTEGANLRVMSYNVLVDNDESLGGWSWGKALGNRGDKASACITYYQPDVIGFQECNYKWHVSLRQNLPDYDFVNPDVPEEQALEKADSLGKKDWMCTTMMYNTKTLTLLENELVGYSCNYWGCIQRMRYVSMALFEIKASGEKFVFISTHLDAEHSDEKGFQMRLTQAGELADCIKRYKETYGCPVISTGDYNSGFSDDPIQTLVSKAGMTASSNNRGGIDYILYSAGIQSKYFTVIDSSKDTDVAGASDHDPVMADLEVTKHTFPTTVPTEATTTTTSAPFYGEASTTKPIVITKKEPTTTETTTGTNATETTTQLVSEEVTTEATSQETTTEAAETTTTTAAQAAAPDESNPPPVWALALAGFGGTAVLGGLAFLAYWLITKKKK